MNYGVNVQVRNKKNASLLHKAAATRYQNLETMQFLINLEADLEAKNNFGWTPLDSATRQAAKYPCRKYSVHFLFQHGADFNSIDAWGVPAL